LTFNLIVSTQKRNIITVSKNEGIKFNVDSIERDVFYVVDYDGEKYATRLTSDGMLETYQIIE
jgi:hypothetical protein